MSYHSPHGCNPQFLASSDPLTLGEYALGTVALVYLAPPLLGGLANSFK